MQRLELANYIKEDIGMSLINKEVADFSAQAYVNDEFKTITKADILGKWSVFFFYQLILLSCANGARGSSAKVFRVPESWMRGIFSILRYSLCAQGMAR